MGIFGTKDEPAVKDGPTFSLPLKPPLYWVSITPSGHTALRLQEDQVAMTLRLDEEGCRQLIALLQATLPSSWADQQQQDSNP